MSKVQISLRSQYPTGQLGLPAGTLELSFKVSGAIKGEAQLAYEIQSALSPDFITGQVSTTVKTASSQFVKAPHVPRASREVSYHRVRIETQSGWSAFSNTLVHETGLIQGGDMVAVAIGDQGVAPSAPALLRTSFVVTKPVARARLYATAHGTFDAQLNGKKVGDHILAPGWTPYQFRVLVETHDLTDQIVQGENVLGAVLADGWYRGKMSFLNMFNNYGDHTSFLAQLEIEYQDGSSEIIATDDTWKTATGSLRAASIYDGSDEDFSQTVTGWSDAGFDDSNWAAVTVREFNKNLLDPMSAPPVRIKAELPMPVVQREDRVFLDSGQNISGWVRLQVDGKAGDTVVIRHAEIVLPDGTLHTAPLRAARATDTYILAKSGIQTLEPQQTFHGFQYSDVVTEAKVISATAIAITSDNQDRSTFESSHSLLNKLHNNVLWSLRDNYLSIPTDCPQRDERLGWTGDAQAFTYAANTLIDSNAFFRSWLKDMRLEQLPNGRITDVIPDILSMQFKKLPNGSPFPMDGIAGWGDASVVIPWAQYLSYGDKELLITQLDSMRGWVDFFSAKRVDNVFPEGIMQLGDWLDPDAPEDRPGDSKVSPRFVASAYISHSARLLAKIEALVGTPENEAKYQKLGDEVATATWNLLGDDARLTTTGCAMALQFELCPAEQREAVADGLAQIVRNDNGWISTGFLGTPLILDALSQNGQAAEAYLMLLRTEIRSWLYPITVGATTIWERWEAIAPDGTPTTGGSEGHMEGSEPSMISFNHYAYGAVVDWIYRNVVGLSLSSPGYRELVVAPLLTKGIDWANGTIETGYGPLGLSWKLATDQTLTGTLTVPFGATAKLQLPASDTSNLTVNGQPTSNGALLNHGDYQFELTKARIL